MAADEKTGHGECKDGREERDERGLVGAGGENRFAKFASKEEAFWDVWSRSAR